MNVMKNNLKLLGDERGSLVSIEVGRDIPFDVKRVYYIFDTKSSVSRGYHAHKKLKQFAVCVKGSCTFKLEDVNGASEFFLDSPDVGILIEGLVWREMHNFSLDCVLMVLASDIYREDDYIRDYNQFKALIKNES